MDDVKNDVDFSDVFSFDEPAEEPEETEEETVETEDTDEEVSEEEGQSEEDNAKYAAARRKAEKERDIAVERAREEERQAVMAEVEKRIAKLNMNDPYAGKVVSNLDDLEKYHSHLSGEKEKEIVNDLKEAGYDDAKIKEMIDTLVAARPEVRQAADAMERLSKLETAAQQEHLDNIFESELEKIKEIDPTIQSAEDLFASENEAQMSALIKKNYSISDAYFIANKEKLMERAASAGAQQTRNNAANKSHLQQSSPHGTGGVTVPEDVMSQFRLINPNASDEEIRAFYERDLKRRK
ncbi:MAG: hypothetical protein ACI4PP_03025 [Clostridia bacterium]